MTTKIQRSRLSEAIVETANDMHRLGIIDRTAHKKITLRHVAESTVKRPDPMTGEQIKTLRESANLSQAVFARYLNLTVGYVSQLERGAKQPTGPALVLLDIIRRKGINTIL